MTLYRDIIKRSLQITWRYKFLWIFGFFATIAGTSSDIGLILNSINDLSDQSDYSGNIQMILTIKMWVMAFLNVMYVPFTATLMLLGLLLAIIAIAWLIFTSMAGIVGAAAVIEQGKRQTFEGVWKIGSANFLPVFGVNLASKIIILLLLFLSIPLLQSGVIAADAPNAALFIFYFTLVFLPSAFIISVITKYAMAYIVIRKKPFPEAVLSAIKLFKANWIMSVEMAFVIFGVHLLFAIGYAISSRIITFALQLVSEIGYAVNPSSLWHIGITSLALIIFALIILVIESMLAVFEYVAWTKLFLKTEKGEVSSKIMRLAGSLPKFFR